MCSGTASHLTALWFIFPARLLAESFTSGVLWKFGGIGWALGDQVHIIPPGIGGGSFLTNTTGELLANTLPNSLLIHGELPMWWFYSISLGVFFLRVAVLALHAHLYRNSADIPAQCRYPQRRSGEKLRPFPDRSVLTVRDMHRSVPAPKRCRDRQRSVGLFLARPPLRTPDRCGSRQLPALRTVRRSLPGRYRARHPPAEQPG